MTQLFHASRLFGAMTLAAGIDAGAFGPPGERRVLLLTNNADIPEIALGLDEAPGFAALRSRFDEVHSWNEIIAPFHPAEWKPRTIEVPVFGRLLLHRLGIDEITEVAIESVIVPPSRLLPGLFKDCGITVYSDGLMAHSPTRDVLPHEISARVTRLLHLGLVPDVAPLLLSEHGVPPQLIPATHFRQVVDELSAAGLPQGGSPDGPVLILGQYLSSLGILSLDEEHQLHAGMLRAVAARGHHDVIFQPHPAARHSQGRELRPLAADLGLRLTFTPEGIPAESLFATLSPALVVSCFSTALTTAKVFFDLPVATMGTEMLLERLTPYENSNRIPVTIVDATTPQLFPDGSLTDPPPVDLPGLINAVAYCMQHTAHPELREPARDYLAANGPARYFKRRRLETLDLVTTPAPPQSRSGLSRLRSLIPGR
ncbi:polysialyltransferase family glycosyltransferase [Acrocarpospora catenulata]|uniref:polysialyltransferase family glycosyltransferase n=1 Tax=Acrocarpospora catenulata TaxID=2836182 RepID=UPI001BDA671E|nr:polysialyltransferase family glycosyltransferase [Acrocarpospora catenulata]